MLFSLILPSFLLKKPIFHVKRPFLKNSAHCISLKPGVCSLCKIHPTFQLRTAAHRWGSEYLVTYITTITMITSYYYYHNISTNNILQEASPGERCKGGEGAGKQY